jgi:hypothetical protein
MKGSQKCQMMVMSDKIKVFNLYKQAASCVVFEQLMSAVP